MRPKAGWTKAKGREPGATMGFWWELDMLKTDCLETWQDLSPWPSASKTAPKCPRSFGGGFEWKTTVLDSDLPLPLLKQELTPASYRKLSWSDPRSHTKSVAYAFPSSSCVHTETPAEESNRQVVHQEKGSNAKVANLGPTAATKRCFITIDSLRWALPALPCNLYQTLSLSFTFHISSPNRLICKVAHQTLPPAPSPSSQHVPLAVGIQETLRLQQGLRLQEQSRACWSGTILSTPGR